MRNLSLAIVAAALAVLTLAACGDDDDDTAAGGGGSDTPVSSGPAGPPAGDANPGAPARRQVVATPGLADPIASAIESYAQVGEATLELRFYMGVEECNGVDRVEVEEAADAVTVTVFVGRKPDAEVCIEIAESVATKVELAEPLGTRALIDGSTGAPIPVE